MKKVGQPYKRISIYCPLPDYEEVKKGSEDLNMAFSSYAMVLIKLGLQVVKVSRDPSMFEYFQKLEQEKG